MDNLIKSKTKEEVESSERIFILSNHAQRFFFPFISFSTWALFGDSQQLLWYLGHHQSTKQQQLQGRYFSLFPLLFFILFSQQQQQLFKACIKELTFHSCMSS